MSATHTRISANSTHCAPAARSTRRRTSASHAGTSASTPALAADQVATRRGASMIHSERDAPPQQRHAHEQRAPARGDREATRRRSISTAIRPT